jgi:hypothetical protein
VFVVCKTEVKLLLKLAQYNSRASMVFKVYKTGLNGLLHWTFIRKQVFL